MCHPTGVDALRTISCLITYEYIFLSMPSLRLDSCFFFCEPVIELILSHRSRVLCACIVQLEATGRESSEIQEAQALQISEMEERLKGASEDKERLKAEGRKMKAHSKVRAPSKARLACAGARAFLGARSMQVLRAFIGG